MLTATLLSDVLPYHSAFSLPSPPASSIHPSRITTGVLKRFGWAPGIYHFTPPQLILEKMFTLKRLVIDGAYL